MTGRSVFAWATIVAVALLAAVGCGREAPALSTPADPALDEAAIERGRQIFEQGTSPSGAPVIAWLEAAQLEVPASTMTCASCHGEDGRGRPEGGVTPSNLTWAALTKPYGVRHTSGREHPAYTAETLVRAITMGIDPAGNKLHAAMPRFRLSRHDARDLVAYLRALGSAGEAGISDDAVRIGLLLPAEGEQVVLAEGVKSILEAYLAEINTTGGVYGRRLELEIVELPVERGAARETVRATLARGRLFALVAGFAAGFESDLAELAADYKVPVIGPITDRPLIGHPPNPFVFYLQGGLETQARVLAREASTSSGGGRIAIVRGDTSMLANAAIDARAELVAAGTAPDRIDELAVTDDDASPLAELLRNDGIDEVIVLAGGVTQHALIERAAAGQWRGTLLLPAAIADSRALAHAVRDGARLVVAAPSLPSGWNTEARTLHRKLRGEELVQPTRRALDGHALAAGRVLVEAMQRTGRDLSATGLIEALESLYEYDTGFLPAVTYTPNRRIGVAGAYVVGSVSAGDTPRAQWRAL